jgi:hypothetical protein
VKTIREFFALLVFLVTVLERFVELRILAMRLRKQMAARTIGQSFRWAEKSAAHGARNGVYELGDCYQYGIGCAKDVERAKEKFLVSAELGYMHAMLYGDELLDKHRFVWLRRAAANGETFTFLSEMRDQIHKFNLGTGHANVVFAIGRALRGNINNEKRTIGNSYNFYAFIGPANEALRFYEFQLHSNRKAVDSWTIVGLRNKVVRDIRKMLGR